VLQLVASLQVDTESGLTPESEVFLKSRLRDVRSNFVNVDKTFDEQPEAVERLVCHLVEEFGAPRQWTRDYLKQFLQSSAGRSNSLSGTVSPSGLPCRYFLKRWEFLSAWERQRETQCSIFDAGL
jgi:hypothetical protein